MLVLIYGGNGWIGTQFIEILYQNNIDYLLGSSRVDNICSGLEDIAKLDDPVGINLGEWSRPNGLKIQKTLVCGNVFNIN